jgi:GH43 family beta-xylosidase
MVELTSTDPLNTGTWKKSSEPVFVGANRVYSPGHNTFFKSPDGKEYWIIYHANNSARGSCDMNRTPASRNSHGIVMAVPTLAAQSPLTPILQYLLRNSPEKLEVY